jgi:phosphoglycolate phosphatase-like HAD superfamily hydrolase
MILTDAPPNIMAKDKIIKALAAARAKVQKLEAAIAAKRNRLLARLHAQHGFETVEEFITALRQAAKGGKGRRAAAPGKRRKRAVITPEVKTKVKSLTEAGKTGAEIAKATGISLPSVQNIKKELGLTKARNK